MPNDDQQPPADQKDAASVRIFPPGVPLATVLIGILLQQMWPVHIGFVQPNIVWQLLGGLIVIASIYFLGFKSVTLMRKSGQSENPYKKTTEIIEAGPYRFTRNPMYLQMVFVCIGFAVVFSNPWIFFLTPVCALLLHFLVILPEEEYLESKFGEHYLEYKRRVRRWF